MLVLYAYTVLMCSFPVSWINTYVKAIHILVFYVCSFWGSNNATCARHVRIFKFIPYYDFGYEQKVRFFSVLHQCLLNVIFPYFDTSYFLIIKLRSRYNFCLQCQKANLFFSLPMNFWKKCSFFLFMLYEQHIYILIFHINLIMNLL